MFWIYFDIWFIISNAVKIYINFCLSYTQYRFLLNNSYSNKKSFILLIKKGNCPNKVNHFFISYAICLFWIFIWRYHFYLFLSRFINLITRYFVLLTREWVVYKTWMTHGIIRPLHPFFRNLDTLLLL